MIGSQYTNHRGGIGSVIETYSKYFDIFNFISSYGISNNKFTIAVKFLKSLVQLTLKFLYDRNIEILHIHGAAKGSLVRKFIIFLYSKYFFNKKVIFHCHGSEMEIFYNSSPLMVKKIIEFFFNNVDLIICLSKSWESFFKINFNPIKIIVLENIVERNSEFQSKNLMKAQLIKFLFLGAIGNRKGIFDLLDVIANNKNEFSGRIKLLVGGNGEISRLKKVIKDYQLQDIVEYKGWVTGDLKIKLFNEAAIYILPSYNEGLPISILEAMSFGMPIISTYVGGIPEIVRNEFNGFLISPDDKQAIYASMKRFIDNRALCKEYGQHSLEVVTPYFAENVIPKLNLIYNQLLTNKI